METVALGNTKYIDNEQSCPVTVFSLHRKFQPKVMAKQYENQLRRLTTSLNDHQGRTGYPKDWPPSLSDFELVVET
jgi:hypothetical protein